jgi:hypothetical protein
MAKLKLFLVLKRPRGTQKEGLKEIKVMKIRCM